MKAIAFSLVAAIGMGGLVSVTSAAITPGVGTIADPGLGGDVKSDLWDFTQVVNADGEYGSFGFTDAWPGGGILSTTVGGSDATLSDAANHNSTFNKVSGYGYLTQDHAIYVGAGFDDVNTVGGSFSISEPEALTGLRTVVFQIRILEANGYDFHDHVLPTLSFNNGTQNLAVNLDAHTQEYAGTFENGDTNGPTPLYVNTWNLRWDLSGISQPIDSFDIQWDTVLHSRMYAMRLDQSDVYTAVPEPATLSLLSLGGLVLLRRRNR